jgi:hypothetical protein
MEEEYRRGRRVPLSILCISELAPIRERECSRSWIIHSEIFPDGRRQCSNATPDIYGREWLLIEAEGDESSDDSCSGLCRVIGSITRIVTEVRFVACECRRYHGQLSVDAYVHHSGLEYT